MAWWEMGLRLLLAASLGAVIGINREHHEWAAGLRTHMLVSVGAALAMLVSTFGFADVLGQPNVNLDPSRIAAQVVSGIGFLCAGTILFMQREQVIRGLTTAAGLWAVAAVGLAAGAGLYAAATLATSLIWVILALLKPLERRYLHRHPQPGRLRLHLAEGASLAQVEAAVTRAGLGVASITLRRSSSGNGLLDLECDPRLSREELMAHAAKLQSVEGVLAVELPSEGSAG